jgi:peptidoglycan/xylan/chitin deacetylase (PgdA/CDA1 family)
LRNTGRPHARNFAWPNGHRIAVLVTVLLENWSERNAPSYSPMTTPLKPGTYDRAGVTWSQYGGNAGIWRLVRILDRFGIKGTICANAKSVEMHVPAIKAAIDHGHEIAAHSYTQDALLAYMSPQEEREMIRRCAAIFEGLTGARPLGWLSPVIASTDTTAEHLAAEGFLWHGDYNKVDAGFRKRSCSDNKQERHDDSKKSHSALGIAPATAVVFGAISHRSRGNFLARP